MSRRHPRFTLFPYTTLFRSGEECVALAEDAEGWGKLCRVISAIHWASPSPDRRPKRPQEREARLGREEGGPGGEGASLATMLVEREGLSILSNDVAFLEKLVASSGTAGLYAELRPGKQRH